jgi:hypothetical protein
LDEFNVVYLLSASCRKRARGQSLLSLLSSTPLKLTRADASAAAVAGAEIGTETYKKF